jgi:hypothetical protein
VTLTGVQRKIIHNSFGEFHTTAASGNVGTNECLILTATLTEGRQTGHYYVGDQVVLHGKIPGYYDDAAQDFRLDAYAGCGLPPPSREWPPQCPVTYAFVTMPPGVTQHMTFCFGLQNNLTPPNAILPTGVSMFGAEFKL